MNTCDFGWFRESHFFSHVRIDTVLIRTQYGPCRRAHSAPTTETKVASESWVECDRCGGAGTIEVSEDRLDSRGEHYTRDRIESCGDCNGCCGVWVETPSADARVQRALAMAARTMMAARRRAAAIVVRHDELAQDIEADAALFVGAAHEADAARMVA